VERQREDCERLCAARGWAVAEVFSDNDTSAYSGKRRPGYEAMMTGLRSGDFDAVVTYAAPRLTRSMRELEDFVETIETIGAQVAVVAGGDIDLSSAAGRRIARIFAAIARGESEELAERQRRKNRERAERGLPHGLSRRPFGYAANGVTVNPTEAAVIRDVVERLLHGSTLRAVTLRLNASGSRTTTGRQWHTRTLRRVLLSPRLNGRREHRGETYPASWEAIVSDDEHAQLVALLTGRAGTGVVTKGRHVLSGLIFCGVCGAPMAYQPEHRTKDGRVRTRQSYACPSRPRGFGCVSIVAEGVEAYVVSEVGRIRSGFDTASAEAGDDVLAMIQERDAAQTRLDGFADDYGAGILDRRQVERASNAARRQIAELDEKIATAAAVTVTKTRRASLVERWDGLDADERREAIRALVYRVDIRRGKPHVFDAASRVLITAHSDLQDSPDDEPGDAKRAWAAEYREAFGVDWRGA